MLVGVGLPLVCSSMVAQWCRGFEVLDLRCLLEVVSSYVVYGAFQVCLGYPSVRFAKALEASGFVGVWVVVFLLIMVYIVVGFEWVISVVIALVVRR